LDGIGPGFHDRKHGNFRSVVQELPSATRIRGSLVAACKAQDRKPVEPIGCYGRLICVGGLGERPVVAALVQPVRDVQAAPELDGGCVRCVQP